MTVAAERDQGVTDLQCLRDACAGRRTAAARRGRDLLDASIVWNLRFWRQSPASAGPILEMVVRRWPKILRGLRRDVVAAGRASR